MIHIAICDDEKHMSDHIRTMASDFFRKKNREICFRTFSSGEELLSYDGQIDILFLDIQMKGMGGMGRQGNSGLISSGDFLMMEIENSFHGNSTFKKGTGLSNINAVAEKYGGAMSIEIQENVCILHVLLIIPPHPESSPQQMD